MNASRNILLIATLATTMISVSPMVNASMLPREFAGVISERSAEAVAYRGQFGGRRHSQHYGYSGHRHHGIGGAGIIGGIVASALIAGAIRESRVDSSDVSRCENAYRSFDADTGTYNGYDGERHVCPYLE